MFPYEGKCVYTELIGNSCYIKTLMVVKRHAV